MNEDDRVARDNRAFLAMTDRAVLERRKEEQGCKRIWCCPYCGQIHLDFTKINHIAACSNPYRMRASYE